MKLFSKEKTPQPPPLLDSGYLNALCEVISDQNDLLNYARIAQIGPDFVALKPTRDSLLFTALYFDTPVKVNIYNTSLGFKVLSGSVGKSTEHELMVNDAQILIENDRRQFFRIRAHAPIQLEPMGEKQPRVLKANLEDISLCGLQFSSTELFERHSWHRVTFDLGGFHLSFRCRVERIIELKGKSGPLHGYGCSLIGLQPNEEEDLHKLLLRLQQQRRARNRG